MTAPVITAPAPATVTAGTNDLAAVPDFLAALVVSDNCTVGASITKTQSPAVGTLVPVGTTNVTIRATDTSGNEAQVVVSLTVLRANRAPVVYAGADQTIRLPSTATLSGTVTDDGLPTGATVSLSWSKASGPGSVTFGDGTAASTTATFSKSGTYTLRLTASDTALTASDDVVVTVQAASIPGSPSNVRVSSGL